MVIIERNQPSIQNQVSIFVPAVDHRIYQSSLVYLFLLEDDVFRLVKLA